MGRVAWAGMRLVLPKVGDALRRAGSCTCLDLLCDEHCWFVSRCPKAGSLALGLALWSFGQRTAWPEVGVYLPLVNFPVWSVLGSSQSRASLCPALSSPNLCDTPALRSCHSPTLSQHCSPSQGTQEMMLRTSCELLNCHERGAQGSEVLGRALLRELCLREPGMELGAGEVAGGEPHCRDCGFGVLAAPAVRPEQQWTDGGQVDRSCPVDRSSRWDPGGVLELLERCRVLTQAVGMCL